MFLSLEKSLNFFILLKNFRFLTFEKSKIQFNLCWKNIFSRVLKKSNIFLLYIVLIDCYIRHPIECHLLLSGKTISDSG